MFTEEQDVNSVDSSDTAQVEIQDQETPVVAAEQTQETPAVPEQQKIESVPYDRFKQIEEERKFWQSKYEQTVEKLVSTRPIQAAPVAQPVVEEDPYAGMDPETERAYRQLDQRVLKLVDKKAEELANKKLEPILRQTQAVMEHFSQIQLKEFRAENPDVAPNSPEEQAIVQKLNAGYSKDDAVWAVMGRKRADEALRKQQEKEKSKAEVKKQANLETTAVPKQNGLPPKKLSFREELKLKFQGNSE